MRISDWSSDVCSSDLWEPLAVHRAKAANKALIAGSLVIFFGCFALIRIHTTIGDTAFLRSMIPHHDPEACAGVHRDSVLLPASGVARHALAGPGSPAASDAMREKDRKSVV